MGADEQGNWEPIVNETFDQVAKDIHGRPYNPCINATYLPSFEVTESGPTIQLGATLTSGSAWFRDPFTGNMRPPVDVTGWAFTLPIHVDYAEIDAQDHQHVPQVVRESLEQFTSAGFAVSRLFCNLQSVDLIGSGLSKVYTGPDTNDTVRALFNLFILFGYLPYIKKHPSENPYVLGYVAKHTSATAGDQDREVPDSLKPIGNTFNLFYDRGDSARNTLNFILNTKSSPIGPGNRPPTDSFDSNWLLPTDIGQAKMVYSFRAFLENMILKNFFTTYANSMREQVAGGGVNLAADNSYDQAIEPHENGARYEIHNVNDGLDRYVNIFDATWLTTDSGIALELNGSVSWYKEKEKHVVILGKSEKARAWAGGETSWTTTIHITLAPETGLDGRTRPVLNVEPAVLKSTGGRSWQDENGVSKNLGLLGDLLGGLITAGGLFEIFGSSRWIEAGLLAAFLIKLPSEMKVNGFTLDVSLKAISKAVPAKIMLPAGDVFEFKTLSASQEGQVSMMLDYLPERR